MLVNYLKQLQSKTTRVSIIRNDFCFNNFRNTIFYF
jgi:hypothetical protein